MWPFDSFRNIVRAAKKAVGKVVEFAGDHLPGRMGDKLSEIGFNMQYPTTAYDSSTATSTETVDFAKECKKASDSAIEQASPIIEEMIQWGKRELDKAQDSFQAVMPSEKMDAATIASCFNGVKDDYQDFIAHEISSDNEQFSKIVKIATRIEREEKIKEYVKEVAKTASDRTEKEIIRRKNEALQKMIDTVEKYLQMQIENLRKEQEELHELQERQGDTNYLAERCGKQIVEIAFLECIRSQTFSA